MGFLFFSFLFFLRHKVMGFILFYFILFLRHRVMGFSDPICSPLCSKDLLSLLIKKNAIKN
jgi:hypothetical protein